MRVALAGAVVAGGLSVLASPPALALDAPANPSPSGAQTGIPTFSWDRVAGATTYDFQISTSDQFNTTLVNVTTVQRQYVPKIQLPTGTQLYWRVRAHRRRRDLDHHALLAQHRRRPHADRSGRRG